VLFFSAGAFLFGQASADRAWNILSAGAAESNAEKRAKAIRALGLIADSAKAQKMAEKALNDEKPEVQTAAVIALGQMGAKSSANKLVEAAKRDNSELVFAAANALYLLGDARAYQVYYAVLTGEKKSGEGLIESQMKMLKDPRALAKIGFESGIGFVPFGGAALQAYRTIRKDDSSPVRAAAAQKLIRDPDPKTRDALARMATDSKWMVRAAVVDAIAKRNDRSLLDSVLPLLNDDNDTVRLTAAATVVHLSARR
jgi:HEAT repeat protein